MNAKILRDSRTISLALLSSLLVVAVTGGIEPQEAKSQNATTTGTGNQTGGATTQNATTTGTGNQTGGATTQNATTTGTANQTGGATTQNQTGTALENLTRSDFEPVTSALNSARDWITGNSTQDAYSSLNDADNVLFRVAEQEGPTAAVIIVDMTEPIRNHIEGAKKALLVWDFPNALRELNEADLELVKITLGLPAEPCWGMRSNSEDRYL